MAWIVKRRLRTGTFYYVRYSLQGRKAWLSAGRSRSSAVKIRDKIAAEIATGARPAELLSLTPASLNNRVLYLRTLKHGPERRVELDPSLARALHHFSHLNVSVVPLVDPPK